MKNQITDKERKLLERLHNRGGATLVIDKGGEIQITAYYNKAPLRTTGVRHD
jgi:hypothetical protein